MHHTRNMAKPGQSRSPLEKFPVECFRCGVCCVKFQAPVNADEVRLISAYLNLAEDEFIRRFSDPRWQGKEKLLSHTNGRCAFLDYELAGKINNCHIHEVRPAACRDWGAGPDRSECREGLSNIWQLSINDSKYLQGSREYIEQFRHFVKSLENKTADESNSLV